ncbi:hypothetical protein WS68_10515 [Burkholderia sp. TSV86]|nr:hypothetical protein WS68_10515 [Burkholderia sp. TSV86]
MYRQRVVVSLPFAGDLPPPPSFDGIQYSARPWHPVHSRPRKRCRKRLIAARETGGGHESCGENETFFARRAATKSARAIGNKKTARAQRMASTFLGW